MTDEGIGHMVPLNQLNEPTANRRKVKNGKKCVDGVKFAELRH